MPFLHAAIPCRTLIGQPALTVLQRVNNYNMCSVLFWLSPKQLCLPSTPKSFLSLSANNRPWGCAIVLRAATHLFAKKLHVILVAEPLSSCTSYCGQLQHPLQVKVTWHAALLTEQTPRLQCPRKYSAAHSTTPSPKRLSAPGYTCICKVAKCIRLRIRVGWVYGMSAGQS